MKIAICDDMDMYLEILKGILLDFFDDKVKQIDIYKFSSGEHLLAEFTAGKYDIIILDMMMKELNGIQTAHEIRKADKTVLIAFHTNYDYINTAKYNIGTYTVMKKGQILQQYNSQLMDMFNYLKANQSITKHLKTKKTMFYTNAGNISVEDILYFKQYYKGVIINTMTDSQKLFGASIDNISLPDFIRTHNKYYVNMVFITGLWEKFVVLKNGEKIPVERKHIEDVKRYLNFILK